MMVGSQPSKPGRNPRFFLFPEKFQLYAMDAIGGLFYNNKGQTPEEVLMVLFLVGVFIGAIAAVVVLSLIIVGGEEYEKRTSK